MTKLSNNQRLINLAESTFGKNWRRPLAVAMGEHHTQVMRWSSGKYKVSDEKLEAAAKACKRKAIGIISA